MNCPNCNTELETKIFNEVEVDGCPDCYGIWFDDDELRKAKDSDFNDLNWIDFEINKNIEKFRASAKDLSCPKCRRMLVAIDYGNTGIEIDYCPDCYGTWLDKVEFKNIIDCLANELNSKPFSEYIKASLKEAKEIVTGEESFASEWKDFLTVLWMMHLRLFVENPKLYEQVMNIQKASPIK